MAIKTVNYAVPVEDSSLAFALRSNPLIPTALIGKAAKRAMETSVGQRVTGFCGKVRQFSQGLIGKAIGTTVKAVVVDGAGFAAGGAAAGAVLAESALTPYIAPAAVAVAAGAAAYKSKSKKVRVLSAMVGLAAVCTAVLAFTSSDKQEGATSYLQGMGLALGVKAGQTLGSFAAQRFVLGTTVNRYKTQNDGWGIPRQRVVDSYPIRLIDFEQPSESHALRMGQYFVAKSALPFCFIGASATRDGLMGALAYNAVPLHSAYTGYLAGRERGLHGKVTDLAMGFVGDPQVYAHTLSQALLAPITPDAPQALKDAFALVLKNIPDQFMLMGEQFLVGIRNVLEQFPTPGLEKTLLKLLKDLPRIVTVFMHSLNEFSEIVRNSKEIQNILSAPEVDADALNAAIGKEIVKKYPSLNITDASLAMALTPLSEVLAQTIVSTGNMITGIPLHADRMQSHDVLTIYLKYLLMGVVTNYSATVMHYNDKGVRLTPAEDRNFLQNIIQIGVSDARLLPAPAAAAATSATNLFANAVHALAPARQKPEVKKGLLGRITSWIGSKFNTLSKAIFGTVCRVVGAARRIFKSK